MDSQKIQILRYLAQGRALTPLDALGKFSCFRLAARIAELKREGHPIVTEMITAPNGARVARYRIGSHTRRRLIQSNA